MSFLQPALLFGLPLVLLPVLIHLINRQRHRTVSWGAMMFLLDAKSLTRGMAKLRQFLILALRTLAVAGLIFALSRPLPDGWLGGVAAGSGTTTLILLDRSASMEQQSLQTGQSKRATALAKVAEAVGKVGDQGRLVLIDSASLQPVELDSPSDLTTMPEAAPTATSAEVPRMMEAALDYIEANQSGRVDVWLCTDLRENDWDIGSGQWESVRARATQLEGLRILLLSYPQTARENFSVRVTRVVRRTTAAQAELVIDAMIKREAETSDPLQIPLEFIVNGAPSTHTVEVEDREFMLQGHTIPIDRKLERGWGHVGLPADSNPADNKFYFAFSEPPVRKTVVVSDDFAFSEAVSLACRAPSERGLKYEVESMAIADANRLDWESAALVVWQGMLPDGVIAQQMENFVAAGKSLVFFPPQVPGGRELFGHRWGKWEADPETVDRIDSWRTDAGVLRNTLGGDALPVGELSVFQHCLPEGTGSVLARLGTGAPLLKRTTTSRGQVLFFGTLPTGNYSSLARDGVVFYVMLQRAIAAGTPALGQAKMLPAGSGALGGKALRWQPLQAIDLPDSERVYNAGAFEASEGEQIIALNRPNDEDASRVLDSARVDQLLEGVEYRRIDDEAGSVNPLASEIWRIFLALLGLAMIGEAILCLPEKRQARTELGMT
ncbi:MAG: BatA domain-containing protein [Verrucomicrobiota bacterium]